MDKKIDKLHELIKLQTCIDSIADSVKTLAIQCLHLGKQVNSLLPKEIMPAQKLLKIDEVMKTFSISRPMVYKMIYEGSLEAIRISKRGIRITEASVAGIITEGKILPFDIGINMEMSSLKHGDRVQVNPDSEEFNELTGQDMIVVRATSSGAFIKEPMERGPGVFVPFSDIIVETVNDINCDLHGG